MENVKSHFYKTNQLRTMKNIETITKAQQILKQAKETIELTSTQKRSKINSILSILSIVSNTRLVIQDFNKSAPIDNLNIVNQMINSFKRPTVSHDLFQTAVSTIIIIIASFVLSILFYSVNRLKNTVIKGCYIILSNSLLFYIVFTRVEVLFIKFLCNFLILTFVFKLYSYLMKETGGVDDKSTFESFYRFILSSAIFYEDNKIRKEDTNYILIAKQLTFSLLFSIVLTILFNNVAVVLMNNISREKVLFKTVDLFISLSIVVYIMFYCLFKVFFDCLGIIRNELSRLKIENNRDWWNSKDSTEFWKHWNIPMHYFIKNHIYIAMLKMKINENICKTSCFVFSGVFHELLVWLTFKKVFGYFFIAMVMQVPFSFVTHYVKVTYPKYANYFFILLFFIIGQTGGAFLMYKNLVLDK